MAAVEKDELLNTPGNAVVFAAFTKQVTGWLDQHLNDAINDIVNYVEQTPQPLIDEMDVFLLNTGQQLFEAGEKRHFLKLYAAFKMAEFSVNGQFCGFPE